MPNRLQPLEPGSAPFLFRQESAVNGSAGILRKQRSIIDPKSYDLLNRQYENRPEGIYLTYLSVISILLRRYTSADEVVIMTNLPVVPWSGNDQARVPISIEFSDNSSIRDCLISAQNALKEAYLNLSKESEAPTNLSNIFVSFRNFEANQLASYDLYFFFSLRDIEIRFDDAHYEGHFISNIFNHFNRVLEDIIADARSLVSTIDIFDVKEKVQLKKLSTPVIRTKAFPLKLIHIPFEQHAATSPDSTAVVFKDLQLSYGELNFHSNELATLLQNKFQLRKGDIIALNISRSEKMIILILAVLKSGCAFLPLDPQLPKQRVNNILQDGTPRMVICDTNESYENDQVISIDELFSGFFVKKQPSLIGNKLYAIEPNSLAYVIYTSGTTGTPKGVAIEHQGVLNMCMAQIEQFGITNLDRILQFASISFDASISEIFMALNSGACLVIPDQESIKEVMLHRMLQQSCATTVTLPPSYIALLPFEKINSLRRLIAAGEACSVKIAHAASKSVQFFNAYGPTEVSVCATIFEYVDGELSNFLPIGTAIENLGIHILNKHQKPVPIGIEGEIWISGVGVGRGYLNAPELTHYSFVNVGNGHDSSVRMYKTGDFGKWLSNGKLKYTGRKDQLLKIRGNRVSIVEIEEAIVKLPHISHAVIIPIAGDDTIQSLVAFVIADKAVSSNEIKQALLLIIPSYMIPDKVIQVARFPHTPNGKVNKDALLTIAESSENTYLAPRTHLEHELVVLWKKIFIDQKIGIRDNFFNIGGSSLMALKLLELIKEKYPITMSELMENQSIEELINNILKKRMSY